MSDMRRFLERVLPWPPAGNAEAYANIHYMFKSTSMDKARLTGRACRTVDEAVKIVDDAMRGTTSSDIYFCTSTQALAEHRTDKLGRPFAKAIRRSENAVQFRALFADVDVKAGGYESQKECIVAVAEFCKASGMPNPTAIVSSGSGGLHIYWTLTEPVEAAKWRPISKALSLLIINHGLKADTGCTIDAARILRVPGTWNFKDGQKPVSLLLLAANDVKLSDIELAVAPYIVDEPTQAIIPARTAITGQDDMSAGIQTRPTISLDDVAKKCPLIAEALATGGATHEEPIWDQLVLVSTFTEGGRADAHRMSHGHPSYSEHETDEKYTRREADQQGGNLGWPQCSTFQMRGCQLCKSCPHLPAGKSPLNLFTPAAPAITSLVAQAPITGGGTTVLPQGYIRDGHDLIYRVVPREDGTQDQILICSYPITKGWVQDNPWTLNFMTRQSSRHATQIHVPFEDASNKMMLAKRLGIQGMAVSEIHIKLTMEFIVSWIQELRRRKDSVVSSTPFGWHVEHGKIVGFSYGGEVFTPTGTTMAASADPQVQNNYTPKGDLSVWKQAAKLITDQRSPQLDAIIAASFAAPLVRHSGQAGFLLSVFSSETGIGKTTTMEIAQAVWGNPQRMQSLDDTQNSVARKAGQLKALPLFWDELKTEADTTKFVKIAFQFTQGKEKDRMRANSTLMDSGTWETMLVVASNDSLLDYVTRGTKNTAAGVARVFEYEAVRNPNFKLDGGSVSRVVAKLADNYGNAGLEYAKFLGQNADTVAQQVDALDTELRKQYKAGNEERFWFSGLCCLLLGATYANHLGLADIDVPNLKKFLFDKLELMRAARDESAVDMKDSDNVVSVLTQFLNAMAARHTLVTDWVQLGPGHPPSGGFRVLNDMSRLDVLYVHIGKEQNLVRISQVQFNEWLRDHGYSPRIISQALVDQLGARKVRVKLGGGTPRVWYGQDWCLEIQDTSVVGSITHGMGDEVTPEVTNG